MAEAEQARPIYLDYQATTPVDPRVAEAMWPFFTQAFGNPHSVHHSYGTEAEAAVERARGEVAALIGAEAREIIFTSGATESNNTAVKGAARFHGPMGKRHVVTVATEHKCVLESAKALGRDGFEVEILPVAPDGRVDLDRLAAAIREDTAVVSVMAANNEIGVLQPISEIGKLCRAKRVLFHTDAAQAAGKVPVDVNDMNIDLLSLSGHKLYGPKGIGALYVRRRPRARISALMDGGGQERTLRSGTVPAPLAVGLGAACRIARAEMAEEEAYLTTLRQRLWDGLQAHLPDAYVNGSWAARLPGNLNVTVPGLDAETLIAETPEVAYSTASACSSTSVEPSYVLSALGLSDQDAAASIRLGLGRMTTEAEIDQAVETIGCTAARLRAEGAGRLAGAGAG
ncbi:aminotransferase class V-fold PLP-dependent enzyme [Rhodovibrio salinarum]|uniref:Cysteine desulfurase n=1 Tax=Rhodovibrio salinarum TaxID=1087 RepID=A0A934V0B1_9PROT|nr:aminotransferase class V-fold PLP-dependent enzyme [Rhodovibrio salinarum]MBK1697618.1 aminotransferase class V-fold PLP-dependent enzyme [Rhodovibrio salinarum]